MHPRSVGPITGNILQGTSKPLTWIENLDAQKRQSIRDGEDKLRESVSSPPTTSSAVLGDQDAAREAASRRWDALRGSVPLASTAERGGNTDDHSRSLRLRRRSSGVASREGSFSGGASFGVGTRSRNLQRRGSERRSVSEVKRASVSNILKDVMAENPMAPQSLDTLRRSVVAALPDHEVESQTQQEKNSDARPPAMEAMEDQNHKSSLGGGKKVV